MSKTGRTNHRRGTRGTPKPERHIIVRSVRRDPPDLRKLSRAVIAMALRDAEAQAEAREGMTNINDDRIIGTAVIADRADSEAADD